MSWLCKILGISYNSKSKNILIELGQLNTLSILRDTSVGLYLGSEDVEDVLLPLKYCPEEFSIGDKLEVFIYLDYEERRIATNIIPPIKLHEFGLLEVVDVTEFGTFMDWGLEKHLFIPFGEQRYKMEVGYWYVVYLDLDKKTGRLFGTNRIENYLDDEQITVSKGEEVDLYVFDETDLGYTVIINNKHKGLVFHNEIFKKINPGDRLKGYIKEVRADGKIDVALQPIGYANTNSKNSELIYKALIDHNGSLDLTDKSSPEVIYEAFGISKKAFKRAIGDLYKQRKISIEASQIKILD